MNFVNVFVGTGGQICIIIQFVRLISEKLRGKKGEKLRENVFCGVKSIIGETIM